MQQIRKYMSNEKVPVWRALPNITLKSGCSDYTEQTEKLRIQTLEDNNLVEK